MKPYTEQELLEAPISYLGNMPPLVAEAVAKRYRPHHPYSPSTLQALEACPCWEGYQSATPHPRTIIGTLSHEAIDIGEDNPKLSDEDTEKIAECLDFFEERKSLMELVRLRAIAELATGLEDVAATVNPASRAQEEQSEALIDKKFPQIEELKETYLPIDDKVFYDPSPDVDKYNVLMEDAGEYVEVKATTAGYIDCALISHDRTYAELFDWKFGKWPVEDAKNNLQGIAYALGLFKVYPTLLQVRYFFKQPNLDYVTDAVIDRKDIPQHYLRIQVVVAKARAARLAGDFATARAYVPACNFCKHIAHCPVVSAFACSVGSKFYPLEIPADIAPSKIHSVADTKLGLRLAEVLTVWAKAFKSTITDRIIRGDGVMPEGYKLESKTPREIKNAGLYREVALKYLTPEEYATTLTAAFGSVEQLIADKAPRGQKKAVLEQFAREIEQCGAVERGETYTFLRTAPSKPNEKITN